MNESINQHYALLRINAYLFEGFSLEAIGGLSNDLGANL